MVKQPNQIIGSFILRNEGDGCLTSKYHHGDSLECPFTEACKRTTPLINNVVYIGTYRTVWLEDNNILVNATLTILEHPNNENIYKLIWLNPDTNTRIFEGSAINFNGMLLGAYWN